MERLCLRGILPNWLQRFPVQLQRIPQPLIFVPFYCQQTSPFQTFAHANQALTGDLQRLHQRRRVLLKPLKLIFLRHDEAQILPK